MTRLSLLKTFTACLALILAPLLSTPTQPAFAAAEEIAYGKTPLTVRPPSGFVDSHSISDDLFLETQKQAGMDGELLKIFLPDAVAQQYAEQRRDAVTRQVTLYGWPHSERYQLDKKSLELVAQTLEGAYANCRIITDDERKNADLMAEAYRNAVETGVSLLVDRIHGENAITHVTLLNYPMSASVSGTVTSSTPSPASAPASGRKPGSTSSRTSALPTATSSTPPPVAARAGAVPAKPGAMLTTAMATTLVLVNDSIVFVTASSIVTDGAPAEHVDWVTYASEAFADMLASANKK